MPVQFREGFDLPPIPVDARRAAWQGGVIRRKVEDAGGYENAVSAAVEAILAPSPAGGASELGRLRVLYAAAYTREELRTLVVNTFTGLGIGPDGG